MPGTLVHDANQTPLANAVNITSSTTGTGVLYNKPGLVRVKLTVASTVSGTNPTLDLEVQSSNSSTFGSGIVSHGKFTQLTATDASGATIYYLVAYVQKDYLRWKSIIGGTSTPTFNGVTITVEEHHYQERVTDSA